MQTHRYLAFLGAGVFLACSSGCGPEPSNTFHSPDGSVDDGGLPTAGQVEMVGAPLIFAPTAQGFSLNVVLRSGDPSKLRAWVLDEASLTWIEVGAPVTRAPDVAEWRVEGLAPGRAYAYEIRSPDTAVDGAELTLFHGRAVTTQEPGARYTFDVLTDSHIPPRDPLLRGDTVGTDFYSFDETTLMDVARDMAADRPDFLIHLGDMLDYHLFGFNEPPPDTKWGRLAYLNYRRLLGNTLGNAAHFAVVGNWEGENGCNTVEEIQRSASQRLLYVPGPSPATYAQGGSPNQDYYAFTWGDALFVVLNVMSYTPTCHLLSGDPGLPDDWTLGEAQRAWLSQTLAGATSKWRFLFIHHTVGGAAGNTADSAYGRGGGQAAHVGEQAWVHEQMLKYGVQIFFYGHDHVFTDIVVDGIHYLLPGSAGAPWKFDTSITGYTQYWPDSGYGRVTVSPQQVIVDFVATGGQVLNRYLVE
jgi:predicted phosphodiesterase